VSVLSGFATPGGEVDAAGCGLYRVYSLVLKARPTLYVQADAVTVGEGYEVFPLVVKQFNLREDWSRPAFAEVQAPSDLKLRPLLEAPLRVSILTTPEQYLDGAVLRQACIDSGILYERDRDARLLVESRHDPVPDAVSPVMPLDLTLTSDPDVIASRLSRGRLRILES
jgi:hypothetical protein